MHYEFALRLPPPDPGKWASGALAVLVHALLAALLFFGVQWQTQPPEETTVEVELYRAVPVQPAVERPAPVERQAPPEPEPVPKAAPRPVPKVEPSRPAIARPDIAINEKHPPKVQPKVPPKPEVKIPPKPEPKPQPKPLPKTEAKPVPTPAPYDYRQELAATEKAVANTKASQAADSELKSLKAAQASAANRKALQAWSDRIRAKIRGNIVLPPNIEGNPEAKFAISLLPDGQVLNATTTKSSGNPALDTAIERAIRKSSPLPLPDNPSVFQREFQISYKPLDN